MHLGHIVKVTKSSSIVKSIISASEHYSLTRVSKTALRMNIFF